MELVAQFWPPDAVRRLTAWQLEHRDLIDELPDNAIEVALGRANPSGEFASVEVAEHYADSFRREVETWEDWRVRVLETSLQLGPSLTVAEGVREAIARSFSDAGIGVEWVAMPGDPTPDDAARWGGVQRIAAPNLTVIASVDDHWLPVHVIELARPRLGTALARVREELPSLPVGVKAQTRNGSCWFSFRPSASPEDIAHGLERVREAEAGSSVVGWDEQRGSWLRL